MTLCHPCAVIMGDFNAHLYDILDRVKALSPPGHTWTVHTARNVSASEPLTAGGGAAAHLHFTVSGASNFMASYDGFLARCGAGG